MVQGGGVRRRCKEVLGGFVRRRCREMVGERGRWCGEEVGPCFHSAWCFTPAVTSQPEASVAHSAQQGLAACSSSSSAAAFVPVAMQLIN